MYSEGVSPRDSPTSGEVTRATWLCLQLSANQQPGCRPHPQCMLHKYCIQCRLLHFFTCHQTVNSIHVFSSTLITLSMLADLLATPYNNTPALDACLSTFMHLTDPHLHFDRYITSVLSFSMYICIWVNISLLFADGRDQV